MSCSPIHLKDYVLNELPEPERRELDSHLKSCAACREELDRLRLTEAALFSLREEEIPQRIAFVSDPVFEPSLWRRWWGGFWGSAARLGFASAALLSGAIVYSAATRPAPVLLAPAASPVTTIAAMPPAPAISEAEIQRRIERAVERSVSASEEAHLARITQLTREIEQTRQDLKVQQVALEYSEKHFDVYRSTTADAGPPMRNQGDMK
jgi:anti-sigma factor RsiW